jgi:hypothetical protein
MTRELHAPGHGADVKSRTSRRVTAYAGKHVLAAIDGVPGSLGRRRAHRADYGTNMTSVMPWATDGQFGTVSDSPA